MTIEYLYQCSLVISQLKIKSIVFINLIVKIYYYLICQINLFGKQEYLSGIR
jgi:hypothetical protein